MSQTLSPTPSDGPKAFLQNLGESVTSLRRAASGSLLIPWSFAQSKNLLETAPLPPNGPLGLSPRGWGGNTTAQPEPQDDLTASRVSHPPRTCDAVYGGPGVIPTSSQALEAARGIHLALWAEIRVWVLTT